MCVPATAVANTAVSSNITTNTTWTTAGSPYDIDANIKVTPSATLTIEPGVTVDFNNGTTATLTVEGTIKALGAASSPVAFTSHQALSGAGAPGQYLGINVSSGNSESRFAYANFSYGANGSGGFYAYAVLSVAKASTTVTVEHSAFEHNAFSGLKVGTNDAATANVSYSTFANNGGGISGGGPAILNVTHSTMSKNTEDGVRLLSTKAGSSLTYNTIAENGGGGVYLSGSCTSALSEFAHGEYNNIDGNGSSSELANQLTTSSACKALPVDWRNNYWGHEVVFHYNDGRCGSTSTPYLGHLAFSWNKPAHSWENPEGPLTSGHSTYIVGAEEYQCSWDTFYIGPGEFLYAPVAGAPEPTGPVFYGGGSEATPNLNRVSCGDPVNCVTGNLFESYTDLSVPGLNRGLTLSRTYNSQAAASVIRGPFGYGWSSEFGETLSLDPSGEAATVTNADGSSVTFTKIGASFTAPAWVQAKLVHNGDGSWSYTLPSQRVFSFSSAGQLQKITDRNGNATTLVHNESGNVQTVTDASGRKLTFAYNGEGLIESIKDPMGHTAKYVYEGGNLTSVTEPGESSARWQYKYDSSHELTTVTDGRGGTVTNEYDGSERVVAQVDPMKRKTTWKYEAGDTRVTAPTSVTDIQFSGALPTQITRAYGTSSAASTKYEYDASDDVQQVTDPNGHATKYEYDGEGNRIKATDANGHETKWTYDSTHDVLTVTTPKGETTAIKRDSHGNAETIERPAPAGKTQLTKYKYDAHGDLESLIDPLERTWRYEYDAYGDRTAETDPEGDERTWKYDEDAHEVSMVSPRGHVLGAIESRFTSTIERDAQERPTKVTDPLGHETKYAYNADGNLEKVTDANGHTTTYSFDADNEPIKVTEPNATTTETGYDEAGGVISQSDGNKHTTKYARNAVGEVTEVTDPLGRKTTKEYDAAGNLTKLLDPAKRTATYTYDPASQLSEVSYSDGKTPTVKYEYDADGERTKMVDGTGTTTNTYDQLDRLTESKNGHGDTVGNEYDLANQQTKITYPGGKAVTRGFDKAGRLEKVSDWLEHTIKFAYDADSDQTASAFPSTISGEDAYTYNEADQLTTVEMRSGVVPVATLRYMRDNVGQVTRTISVGLPGEATTPYTYDENNRLTKAGTAAYEYDSADNPTRTGESINTFNEADELTKGTGVEYSYDELGARTKRTPSSGPATAYAYDQAGDLASVNRPAAGEVPSIEDSYAYDGNGLRASQTISGSTSYLTWDHTGSLPLLLSDGSSSYIYGPSGLPVEQISGGGAVLYLHHDQQGSTRLLTASTGTVEGSYSFDAYGNAAGHSGSATTPLGYDGQYTSADTGLIYLRARAYDPATAQFVSSDPLAAVTRARYGYVGDNPLNGGDPSGLDESLLETLGNLGAGALDTVTLGGSTEVFDAVGLEPNTCSSAFQVGGVAVLAVAPEEGAIALPETLTLGRNAETGVDVYVGFRDGKPVYTGITNNLARRAAEHGDRFDIEAITRSSVTRGEARAIEQALVLRNRGANAINSISPNHPWYQQAVDWGERWLQGNGY